MNELPDKLNNLAQGVFVFILIVLFFVFLRLSGPGG